MAKRRNLVDEKKIERWIKEGRGQGEGARYLPWFKIKDFSSRGRRHRIFGRKTGRIHHLFSDHEWRLFLCLDWCDDVTDIREQYPLDRKTTLSIAEELGIRHPVYPVTKVACVMTTDFLVTICRNGKTTYEACYVKPSKELEKPRVLAKLEIERRYWEEQGVPLRIFTEKEFPRALVQNLDWLYTLAHDKQVEPWAGFHREQVNKVLSAIPELSHLNVKSFCGYMDKERSLKPGSTLTLIRHLLSIKAISIDLNKRWSDNRPMTDLTVAAAIADYKVA